MGSETRHSFMERIQEIDRRIMDLLNRRAGWVRQMANAKSSSEGPAVFVPATEMERISNLIGSGESLIPSVALRGIFEEINSACRALLEPDRVAYLGPEATFSHMAVLKHFGSSCELCPQASIIDVFQEVERDRAGYGVVPVENSTEGAVSATLDGLIVSDLRVCGEIFVHVAHVLMSTQADLSHIEKVISHPQPLNQCRNWLARNLPGRTLVEAPSTAIAAQMVQEDRTAAAIGSELLAKRCNFRVLVKDIQDRALNLTRFFVLGRQEMPQSGKDKTSALFVAEHKPGSLYRALKPFADQGINLTRIESRPTKEQPWEYVFFVDFHGHIADKSVYKALQDLKSRVEFLKVLGSYSRGEQG